MSGEENLRPFNTLTEDEQRELARKGGIASGEARRQKRLMSQIYAEFLEKEHDVIGRDGEKHKLKGHALLSGVMSKVLARGDGSAVSLMKEIREATEGSKIAVTDKADEWSRMFEVVGADTEATRHNSVRQPSSS